MVTIIQMLKGIYYSGSSHLYIDKGKSAAETMMRTLLYTHILLDCEIFIQVIVYSLPLPQVLKIRLSALKDDCETWHYNVHQA